MSKLAHSNDDTMFDIEFRRVVQAEGIQTALYLSKEIRKERWDRLVEKSNKRFAEAREEARRQYDIWLLTDRIMMATFGFAFGCLVSLAFIKLLGWGP